MTARRISKKIISSTGKNFFRLIFGDGISEVPNLIIPITSQKNPQIIWVFKKKEKDFSAFLVNVKSSVEKDSPAIRKESIKKGVKFFAILLLP